MITIVLNCMQIIVVVLKLIGETTKSVFSSKERSVKGDIVLITGAGHGIGKELALQYAALGATVVCWGITRENNVETIDTIARLGYPKAYFYLCDVRCQESVMLTAKKVQKEVGDVTILVNNAGVAYSKPFLEHTPMEIDHSIDVNIKAHIWTIQAFLPAMLNNNYGHIVANCSVSGLSGIPYATVYSATKFAVRGIMEALSRELQKNTNCNIKTTTVCAFFVKTPMFKHASFRFGFITPKLDVPYVASKIISAQRKNIVELSIPGFFSTLIPFMQLFPHKLTAIIFRHLNINVLPTTTLDRQLS